MTYENCNLFKRSYTTTGLGFTFNQEPIDKLMKEDYRNNVFSTWKVPSAMKSTDLEHALTVVLDSNAEEVELYRNSMSEDSDTRKHKPKEISVSLHNPKEPADTKFIPLTSTRIPLGHSTTFLISAKARQIDESGKELTELQRGCRLEEDTKDLDMFNVYTRTACLLECRMKYAMTRCGCTPWNYPINMIRKVVRLNKIIHVFIFFVRMSFYVTFMEIYVLRSTLKMLHLEGPVTVPWDVMSLVTHSAL